MTPKDLNGWINLLLWAHEAELYWLEINTSGFSRETREHYLSKTKDLIKLNNWIKQRIIKKYSQ